MFNVKTGFVEIETKDPTLRSFLVPSECGNARVNVWTSKNGLFTVGTYLVHPKKGKSQLFRRNLTEREVLDILKHPRKHTGKGYSRARAKNRKARS